MIYDEPEQSVIDEALKSFPRGSLSFIAGSWVNEAVKGRDLKVYIFDWDDNILTMPTKLHLEEQKEEGVWEGVTCSTAEFRVLRKKGTKFRFKGASEEEGLVEFQDEVREGRGGGFLKDVSKAIDELGEEGQPLSFQVFKKTVLEGRLFAIVTARGHSSLTVRKGILYVLERVLGPVEQEIMMINLRGYLAWVFDLIGLSRREVLDIYLDKLCQIYPINSPSFQKDVAKGKKLTTQEEKKQVAIHEFIEGLMVKFEEWGLTALGLPIAFGFSDDDKANVEAVKGYIKRVLGMKYPTVKFCVYDTSGPKEEGVRKTVLSGQLELGLDI